jgi:predicted ester cyclase
MARVQAAPTNKSVKFEQIHIFRVANGQIVEHWMGGDFMALFRQLGMQVTPAA